MSTIFSMHEQSGMNRALLMEEVEMALDCCLFWDHDWEMEGVCRMSRRELMARTDIDPHYFDSRPSIEESRRLHPTIDSIKDVLVRPASISRWSVA